MNLFQSICFLFILSALNLAKLDDPCNSAIKISNPLRSPDKKNTYYSLVELCDSDLKPNTWYDLGGKITNTCVDINSCSTYSGIWYSGNYPIGDEIVTGKVCAKTDDVSCCGWTETIKIKKCPTGYVYQLAIPDCPMSYCVGPPEPCSKNEVFDKKEKICLKISSLEKPILSKPYISASKVFVPFNATAFSVDCIIKSNNVVPNAPNRKLKVEVIFWMNEVQVKDIIADYPVNKITLEESYLKGHIGKTLTCTAQLFYVTKDGSQTTKTDVVTSEGYYFGINAVDSNGVVIKEMQINQGVPVEIHLQSTFPITFGHCVKADQCNTRKYSFTTKENKLSQNDCEIQFENPSGLLVSKSTTSIKLSTKVTLGIENNTLDNLAFNTHVSNETIFENFTIAPIQVKVIDDKPQPTCHTTGDPHIVSFSGVRFNNYFAGDFNLLSTKHRRFQIQVRQIPCFGGTVSCNCGVIVREGNNVVGINSCDYRKNPMIIDLMRDNVNPSASISKIRNDYLIQFVSGISIKVNFFYDRAKQATYLNIYVNALKHEEYEGMCDAKKGSKIEPLSFKIPNEQSFFKDQLPPCVNEPYNFSSCKCIGNKEGPVSLVCDYDKPDTTIDIIKFDNICDLEKLLNGKIDWIIPRKTSEKDIANDLSLFDVFKTINNSIDHQIFKEIINMPMDKAQDHCSKALKQSKYFDKCKEILQEKYENIMQNCVEDAQLSGNLDVVQTYLNVYEEDCITTLGKQVVITGGNPSPNSDNVTKVIGEMNETFSEREANASTPWTEEEIPSLEKPILSEPYISAYKMYDTFNATAFAIDCILNSDKAVPVIINKKLKVEVIFKMNNMEVAKFEVDYPVDKVSLEESYLRGHVGKTLTCQARLFYILDDGSVSTNTDLVTSEGYYFGINAVDSTGAVIKEIQLKQGVPVEIHLQSTFPITFGHCVKADQCNVRKYSFTTKENKLSQNDCQIQFENPSGLLVFKSTTSIKLSAKVTLGIEKNTLDNLAFNTHISNESLFDNFTIASIKTKVVELEPQPSCHTTGDPHIISFSGFRFNNYFSGDFNLLSAKHRSFQIQVRQIPCLGGTVSCNCGVMAREQNNVVGINSCDYRKTPMIIDLMRDNVNPSASIKKINNDYLIQFVSGISIKVNYFYYRAKQATYLNIYVNGLKHEEYEGMCAATKGVELEPLRIPHEQSFFKCHLPPCVNEPYNFSSCKCIGNKEGPVSLACDYDKPDTTINIIKFDNICDLKNLQKGKIDEIVSRETSENDVANDLTLVDVFKTINNSIDKQIVTEIINMPIDKAQDHCARILKQSKYFNVCKEILKDVYQGIQHSCVEDAQLSGNLDAVQIYLNIYEQVCITTLGQKMVYIDGKPSPESSKVIEVFGEMKETFSEREANASTPWTKEEIPSLEKPILSEPYISAYKMYDTFNATAFSIDCILNSEKAVPVIINKKLKVEVIFKMNNMKVAKFEVDYPVDKVSLEESYLRGHIGKTLTCEARLFNILDDGSVSSKTDVVTSEGYYFGINAVDFTGTVLKEIQMQHGINKEIYFQLTFPISFGHCVYTDQCNLRKYTFATKDNNISLNYCHMQFDNPLGLLVYNASTTIKILALVKLGSEYTRDILTFNINTLVSNLTIFENFTSVSIPIFISEGKKQPTCHTVGDPNILSFSGAYFQNYLAGDFNLLSTKHRTFQIQVRQIPCFGGTVSCNCGVIAREGNNLIGINSCDYRKTPMVLDIMRDNVNPLASISKINNDYLIQFSSGISIKVNFFFESVKQATYLNIHVKGLKHEDYEGMCAFSAKPDLESLRIPYADSFFKEQLPPCVNEANNYPAYKCVENEKGNVSMVCGCDQPVKIDDVIKFDNICDLKKVLNRTAEVNVTLIISGKNKFALTIKEVFQTIDRAIDKHIVIETIKMPLNESQDHCAKAFKLSKHCDKCQKLMKHQFESIEKSCIADVQLSGKADVAQIYLDIFEEVCMTTLGKEVMIVDGEASRNSSEVVEMLGQMNETYAERHANASTPWVEDGSELMKCLKNVKPGHVILFSGTIMLIGSAVMLF